MTRRDTTMVRAFLFAHSQPSSRSAFHPDLEIWLADDLARGESRLGAERHADIFGAPMEQCFEKVGPAHSLDCEARLAAKMSSACRCLSKHHSLRRGFTFEDVFPHQRAIGYEVTVYVASSEVCVYTHAQRNGRRLRRITVRAVTKPHTGGEQQASGPGGRRNFVLSFWRDVDWYGKHRRSARTIVISAVPAEARTHDPYGIYSSAAPAVLHGNAAAHAGSARAGADMDGKDSSCVQPSMHRAAELLEAESPAMRRAALLAFRPCFLNHDCRLRAPPACRCRTSSLPPLGTSEASPCAHQASLPPSLLGLPQQVFCNVLDALSPKERHRCMATCRTLWINGTAVLEAWCAPYMQAIAARLRDVDWAMRREDQRGHGLFLTLHCFCSCQGILGS